MHYYPHNIKEFNSATRHLTRVERSLYRDAIELYYHTESALDGSDFDRLARKLMAIAEEERAGLKYVLEEFFHLVDGEYKNLRCEEELEKYRATSSAKSTAGKASAEARRKKKEALEASANQTNDQQNKDTDQHNSTDDQQTLNKCSTNQEPRTKNQEEDTSVSSPQSRKTQVPANFKITESMISWATAENITVTLSAETTKFIDHAIANGRTQKDWVAAWRNWIRKAGEQQASKVSQGKTPKLHNFGKTNYKMGYNEDGSF